MMLKNPQCVPATIPEGRKIDSCPPRPSSAGTGSAHRKNSGGIHKKDSSLQRGSARTDDEPSVRPSGQTDGSSSVRVSSRTARSMNLVVRAPRRSSSRRNFREGKEALDEEEDLLKEDPWWRLRMTAIRQSDLAALDRARILGGASGEPPFGGSHGAHEVEPAAARPHRRSCGGRTTLTSGRVADSISVVNKALAELDESSSPSRDGMMF